MWHKKIGDRLKEQRQRRGYSQQALADAIGASKASMQNWEGAGGSDTFIPADKLEACARLGLDVQYILTGVESANLDVVAEEAGQYHADTSEKKLVDRDLHKAVMVAVDDYLEDNEQEMDPNDKSDLVWLLLDMVTSKTVQKEGAVISLAGKVLEFKRHGGKK